ncbi:MAG: ParB/RepB/Spo0J family partition protein [Syntrophomonadaceae bacterium]|nr:ParB/RepB/Spo0J family partition protein [Syntrophomonadaceae bacterium]
MSKRGLGKGLDALFSGDHSAEAMDQQVSISRIVVRGDQPRKNFNQDALEEMAASIKEHGILQPLLVRPLEDGQYELIAGERRLRAAVRAGLEQVPVMVKPMDDSMAREAAMIENLQREDLNPIEEALAFREMMDRYRYTQEELARRLSKSRSYITNSIRILNLPQEIQEMVESGQLTAGHARAVLSAVGETNQINMARKIVGQGLSVRESEGLSKKLKVKNLKDPNLLAAERCLEDALGTRVRVTMQKTGGRIEVDFRDDEELSRIMEILGLSI